MRPETASLSRSSGTRIERIAGRNRPVRRALLGLLPFFALGLALGPDYLRQSWRPAIAVAALVLGTTVLRSRQGFWSWALVFFLIGSGYGAQAMLPPSDPAHVRFLVDKGPVSLQGLIAEPPQTILDRTRIVIQAEKAIFLGSEGARERSVFGRVYLTVKGRVPDAARGARVRFFSTIRPITGFCNPGGFDYERYMAAQGIWAGSYLSNPDLFFILGGEEGSASIWSGLDRFRSRILNILEESVEQPAYGLLCALLVGERDVLAPDLDQAFSRLGLNHLLAISGLHIGVAAVAGYALFHWLLLRWPLLALRFSVREPAVILALIPVLAYTILSGGRSPTIRAAIMVSVFALTILVRRRKDPPTALALAGWVILILSPGAIFLASFQLSFAAMFGILLFFEVEDHRRPQNKPERKERSIWRRKIMLAFGVPVAAFLSTLPFVIWHFHHIPLLSWPANLVFTPLISMTVVPFGLAGMGIASFWPQGAGLVFMGIERILWIILPGLKLLAEIPGIDPLIPRPGPGSLIAFYLVIGALCFLRPLKKAGIAVVLVLTIWALGAGTLALVQGFGHEFQVTFLDVGQGNSALIEFPDGTCMVVDGGGFGGSSFDPGQNIVAPFLLTQGIRQLDLMVLSHPQTDHVRGLPYLARQFRPREFWAPPVPSKNPYFNELMAINRQHKTRIPGLAEMHGPRFFGEVKVQVLAPAPVFLAGQNRSNLLEDLNDNSLVLKVTWKDVSFLFPGDLEALGEQRLLHNQPGLLGSDVLLAPHHGSAGSLTPPFLSAVKPRIVVFSAGRYSSTFPSAQSLERARTSGAGIFITGRDGAVTIRTDGHRIEATSHRTRRMERLESAPK